MFVGLAEASPYEDPLGLPCCPQRLGGCGGQGPQCKAPSFFVRHLSCQVVAECLNSEACAIKRLNLVANGIGEKGFWARTLACDRRP